MKTRAYNGYPIHRIIAGIVRIQRRNASKSDTWDRDAWDAIEKDQVDIYWYLQTFGFNDTDEFVAMVAARTSATFAERIILGSLSYAMERRESRRIA